MINPTLESVTEAKITTANYDAEFGVASAGVVSAQTKSGTNQMHGNSGMPAFFINGYGSNLFRFGYALGVNGCNCPLIQNESQYQFVNNWTKIQGNHTFKFGADIRRALNLRVPSDRHRSGELNFDAARTQGPTSGGSGLATFLMGDVSRFERYVSNSLNASESQNRWFFFVQDSWRSAPRRSRAVSGSLAENAG